MEGFCFYWVFIIMKYIITESQYELLSESDLMDRLKRRVTKESFMKYILETQEEFPDLCGDYGDEYEYSGNIIAQDGLWLFINSSGNDWGIASPTNDRAS